MACPSMAPDHELPSKQSWIATRPSLPEIRASALRISYRFLTSSNRMWWVCICIVNNCRSKTVSQPEEPSRTCSDMRICPQKKSELTTELFCLFQKFQIKTSKQATFPTINCELHTSFSKHSVTTRKSCLCKLWKIWQLQDRKSVEAKPEEEECNCWRSETNPRSNLHHPPTQPRPCYI